METTLFENYFYLKQCFTSKRLGQLLEPQPHSPSPWNFYLPPNTK